MSCYINLHVSKVITLKSNIKALKPPRTTRKTFKTKDLEQSEEGAIYLLKRRRRRRKYVQVQHLQTKKDGKLLILQ